MTSTAVRKTVTAMLKLVIAEKPSVAVSIANVIGADKKCKGYREGNGYIVSWCIGHLAELCYLQKILSDLLSSVALARIREAGKQKTIDAADFAMWLKKLRPFPDYVHSRRKR